MHEPPHWSLHCSPTKLKCGDILKSIHCRCLYSRYLQRFFGLCQFLPCSVSALPAGELTVTQWQLMASVSTRCPLTQRTLRPEPALTTLPRLLFCSRSRLTSDTGRTSKVPLSRPRPNLSSLRCRRAPSLPTPTGTLRPRRPPCTGPWNRR